MPEKNRRQMKLRHMLPVLDSEALELPANRREVSQVRDRRSRSA
jgi:hypothetical protein